MDALRTRPVFAHDHETRKQIRETRATLLEHLAGAPDDFQALVLADVIGELDPDRDPELAAHRARFRASRAADWPVRARQLGLDRLLYHLAHGLRGARMSQQAIEILERRAAEIGEARATGVAAGHLDESCVPADLAGDRRVQIDYHASGHLARVAVHLDDLHEGELELAEIPGSGHFRIVEKRGGYGTMIREDYRDGGIVTTLNTPWHDGEESISIRPWTRWVEECLAELARLTSARRPARRSRRRGRGRRGEAPRSSRRSSPHRADGI